MSLGFLNEEVRKINGLDVYYYDNIEDSDKAIVFIVHGLMEHAARYNKLAEQLKENGFACASLDLPGHGKTSNGLDGRGVWPDNGFEFCIDSVRDGISTLKGKFTKPIILLGHSMGSFISLSYIEKYGDEIKGCILSGTNDAQPALLLSAAKIIAAVQCAVSGSGKPSKLLNNMSFGSYNKPFQPNRTEFDWLSCDTSEVDKYIADDYCGFIPTSGLFKSFLNGLSEIYRSNLIELIPKDLPIFIFAGLMDAVGNFG